MRMEGLRLSSRGFTCLALSISNLLVIVYSTSHAFKKFKAEIGLKHKEDFIYHVESSSSVFRCAARCRNNEGCLSLSYNKDLRLCWLSKNKINGSSDLEKLSATGNEWTALIGCLSDWINIGDKCYLFEKTLKSYSSAKDYCIQLGGKLAEPKTKASFDLLRQNRTERIPRTFYWIGLNDLEQESQFVWDSSGTLAGYSVWGLIEPDGGRRENCVGLHEFRSYNWTDLSCNRLCFFICEN